MRALVGQPLVEISHLMVPLTWHVRDVDDVRPDWLFPELRASLRCKEQRFMQHTGASWIHVPRAVPRVVHSLGNIPKAGVAVGEPTGRTVGHDVGACPTAGHPSVLFFSWEAGCGCASAPERATPALVAQ